MNRAWLIDFLSAVSFMVITIAVINFMGGPPWAAAGFGLVVYLQHPPRYQAREGATA